MARASALAGSIHDAYEAGTGRERRRRPSSARRLDRQVAWLAQVVSGLPERAQAAIEHAMAGAPGLMLNAWAANPESGAGVQLGNSGRRRRRFRARAADRTRGARPAGRTTTRRKTPRRRPSPRRSRTGRRSRTPIRATMRSARRCTEPGCPGERALASSLSFGSGGHQWRESEDGMEANLHPVSARGLAESREAGVSGPRAFEPYRRRLRAFTFASAIAPSEPRKTTARSSTGTVIG